MFIKPLIFFDSEFSSLNPYEGEILSIGMVKENGDEFYLELRCERKVQRRSELHNMQLSGHRMSGGPIVF